MDIGQTLQDVTEQKGTRENDDNQKCVHDLRVVSPQDDMARTEKEKEELVEVASEWTFPDEKYAAFTNSHLLQCRVLWANGGAGTEKTMLLVDIIRHISHQSAVFARTLSYFWILLL